MSYQVLARKYRPKRFDELLGQAHVSQALTHAIATGRLHHAYLFTGTRGVGKTTIARILAKCLNCQTGETSAPCGVCEACVAIDEGRFLDLIEIDAASRTKVEDTRELLENVPYAPVSGRYKVYLIDEVHMLSVSSFNALLKTLEEPPGHVKFILATTDPQKVPVTVLSRCLQFVLRPLSVLQLEGHLAHILSQEGISFDQDALAQLAQGAKGSVRDALSLTDQAIAFGGGTLSADIVFEMLGLLAPVDIESLIVSCAKGDSGAVGDFLEAMRAKMVNASMLLDALLSRVHALAMAPILGNQADRDQSSLCPPEIWQLYYQILLDAKMRLDYAPSPLGALEMATLRMLAFRPLADTQVLAPLDAFTHSSPSNADTVQDVDNSLMDNAPKDAVKTSSALHTSSLDKAVQNKTCDNTLDAPPVDSYQDNDAPDTSNGKDAVNPDAIMHSPQSTPDAVDTLIDNTVKTPSAPHSDAVDAPLFDSALSWALWVDARHKQGVWDERLAQLALRSVFLNQSGKGVLITPPITPIEEKGLPVLLSELTAFATHIEHKISPMIPDAPTHLLNHRNQTQTNSLARNLLASPVLTLLKSRNLLIEEAPFIVLEPKTLS